MNLKTVFISSTSRGLEECRAAVHSALRGKYHCIWMEDFTSSDETPMEYLRRIIPKCDLFLCIVGPFHGSCPDGGKLSFTEEEYEGAKRAGIPRMVFVTSDEFRTRAGHRESDESYERQRAFRARVMKERLVTHFTEPSELPTLVLKAILKLPTAPVAAQVSAGPAREESAGALAGARRDSGRHVHLKCDRGDEVAAFSRFFKDYRKGDPGRPQLYLIAGERGDSHDSLIERFMFEVVEPVYREREEQVVYAPLFKTGWVYHGSPEELKLSLVSMLSRDLDEYYDEARPTAASLSARPAFASAKVVAIRHKIDAKEWNEHTAALIEWYASFWGSLERRDPAKLFLIFIAVVYPEAEGGRKFWPFARRSDRETIKKKLASVVRSAGGHCPCLLLGDLRKPTRADVDDWFSRHWPCDTPAEGLALSEAVFAACGGRADMSKIELKLREVVRGRTGEPREEAL